MTDLPPAVKLVLHDVAETDLLDAGIAQMKTRIPEWIQYEGSSEIVLMEGLAVLIGQSVYALNQLPGVVLDDLLSLWGVARQVGQKAVSQARILMITGLTGARTIPAGTRFRVQQVDGSTLDFLVTDPVTWDPSDGRVFFAPVAAEFPGSYASGVTANTTLSLVDPLQWIESAVLFLESTGGTDGEQDDAYYARAAAFLRRQTSALVLASHFESAALDVPGIGRSHAINLWDGTGSTGSDLGHITVAVTDIDGAAPDSGVLSDLQSSLASRAIAGLNVHVVGPNLVDYPLSVTLDAQPGENVNALRLAVLEMLRGWLSPLAWPWGGTLHKNDVITRVGSFPGVLRVTAVTGTAVDLAVTDPIQLPAVTSTITVVVN